MYIAQVTPGQPSYNPEAELTLHRPPLLLTRPADASARFAARVRTRLGQDWPVVIAPLMQTLFLQPALPRDAFDGVIFTSETAVLGIARLTSDRHLPAYCVGPRTAEVAARAGFSVTTGPGDAQGLARELGRRRGQRLLYPRGVDAAQDMTALLEHDGISVESVIVYDQRPCDLTSEARVLLAACTPLLVPLFSARSARLLAAAARHPELLIAALSPAVAEAAALLSPRLLWVAERPDGEALLDVLEELANRPDLG